MRVNGITHTAGSHFSWVNNGDFLKRMNSPACLNIPHEVYHNPELSSFMASTLLRKTAVWIMHKSLSIPIKYSFAFTEATFSRMCFALIRAPPSAWNIRFTYNRGVHCSRLFTGVYFFHANLICDDGHSHLNNNAHFHCIHTALPFMDLLKCLVGLKSEQP